MAKTGCDMIREGKAVIAVPKYAGGAVSRRMPVFYNPLMKSNRDVTVLLMAVAAKRYGIKRWIIADPMAATGVRGIRMLLELGSGNIETLKMNDYSAAAVKLIKKNLRLNKTKLEKKGKVAVENNEANKFLLQNKPFNYVDIDPFGYPGPFLDAAVKRIKHKGILAVTATDTSALAGAAPAACKRKYITTPLKNSFMHETGIRVLVRLVQLIGAMHEKAMLPVFSYYKDHYIRAFFLCKEGSGRCDELLRMHKEILYCRSCCEKKVKSESDNEKCGSCGRKMLKAGPLWAGNLFDKGLATKIAAAANKNGYINERTKHFLKVVAEEAATEEKLGEGRVGFYAIEDVCQKRRINQQPKTADVIKRLQQGAYAASPTHCTGSGVKTNADIKAVTAAAKGKRFKS